MLLRCISIQTKPYSLQSKLITTLYLFLVSQLRKKVRLYIVYECVHGRNIFHFAGTFMNFSFLKSWMSLNTSYFLILLLL